MEINQEETRIDYSEKNPNDEAGLERETRFELATPTLARLCSTTELFPHALTDRLRSCPKNWSRRQGWVL